MKLVLSQWKGSIAFLQKVNRQNRHKIAQRFFVRDSEYYTSSPLGMIDKYEDSKYYIQYYVEVCVDNGYGRPTEEKMGGYETLDEAMAHFIAEIRF